jgi:hypothetical protein
MTAITTTQRKVDENTNTTNSSAAVVKKIETKVDNVESDVSKLACRVLSLEGKGEAKGATKGGAPKLAVFPMSPRAAADPLWTHDPWARGGNRAAGLGSFQRNKNQTQPGRDTPTLPPARNPHNIQCQQGLATERA